jgi:diguanylate cyclase (GGDEF)-like protein
MDSQLSPRRKRSARPSSAPFLSDGKRPKLPGKAGFLDEVPGWVLVPACFLLVALIAVLDRRTESRLSFSLFYLIPVVAAAWWGGFAHGILISIAGAIAWQVVDSSEFSTGFPTVMGWNGVVRFGTLVLVSSLVSRLRAGMLRERRLARTDLLTGAANGRTFYEAAAAEADRARRALRSLTLAYLDLDDFKKLNDQCGHAVGDAALLTVVQTIQPHLRRSDLLARLGGDEFALLLPEASLQGVEAFLGRLQGILAMEMMRRNWSVGVSVGAVTFPKPPADIDLMVRQADAMMYKAKRKGKGRIEHRIVDESDLASADAVDSLERRATARVLCNRAARIQRPDLRQDEENFATVRDISATGVGLHLEVPLPADTLLVVHPLTPGPRTLLARVINSRPDDGGWRHGCELSTRLSADDLCCWIGEQVEATTRARV